MTDFDAIRRRVNAPEPAPKPETRSALNWSPQQEGALKAVAAWFRDPNKRQWFYLAGYAGTGKTTLAMHFAKVVTNADDVAGGVRYGAFTGKAAQVMRQKGCEKASTIHRMIYRCMPDERGILRCVLRKPDELDNVALIVIDEVSMVGEKIAKDLLSFGRPVLVIGDPFQLPPVKDAGYFTNGPPDYMLTEIHRQARDNPIISLSMIVRTGGQLQVGTYGDSRIVAKADVRAEDVFAAGQALYGQNDTRRATNKLFREHLGFKGDVPNPKEQLVCLRNNHARGILNGQTLRVHAANRIDGTKHVALALIEPEETGPVLTYGHMQDFDPIGHMLPDLRLTRAERLKIDRFDYGYALTVHKAQGSQWDDVFLYDESEVFGADAARWLYTGITRAAKRITVAV